MRGGREGGGSRKKGCEGKEKLKIAVQASLSILKTSYGSNGFKGSLHSGLYYAERHEPLGQPMKICPVYFTHINLKKKNHMYYVNLNTR